MVQHTPQALAALYEADETAWLETTADLISSGRLDQVDYANLAEYLLDMARRDKREVTSRLGVLIAHLLKWRYQPDHQSKSWRKTIEIQRQELAELLQSAVLRRHAEAELNRAYANGVRQVVAETDLSESTFPNECPFSLDELFTAAFE